MPEITRIRTISKQTHLNRVPLETDIIQAPHPCKQQMNSTVLDNRVSSWFLCVSHRPKRLTPLG